MATPAVHHLEQWLYARLAPAECDWLRARVQLLQSSQEVRDLHVSLGLAPRKLGRQDLALTAGELADFTKNTGLVLNTDFWSIETAARLLLLCIVADKDEAAFGALFQNLCQSADLHESITFYRGISLYPHSERLDMQVGEGLRTSIRAVFESIAHHNPYPALHFDENRWNHMVLKALFIDSPLWPIQGLDERANPELARILCDYAHERWAAHRSVSVELWRCVGPFASGTMFDDLVKVSESGLLIERQAALLALSRCSSPEAAQVLDGHPDWTGTLAQGEPGWESLGREAASMQQSGDSE